MSIEFDTPATRVIKQFSGKDEEQFRIPTDLPDLTFLRQLSIQGRLRYDRLAATDTTTLSITPATGETRFIYQILFNLNGTGVWTITISNAGITRTVFNLQTTANGGNNLNFVYTFIDSLVGNGTDSIDILATEAAGTAAMNITTFGWTENTSRIRDVSI